MDRLNTSDARDNLADVLNRVAYAKERVRILRRGRAIAAVVPIEDLELLERLEDEVDIREARKSLAEAEKVGTIPWDEVKRDLGM